MIQYKTTILNGLTVRIVEAKKDSTHDVVFTVMADKFGPTSKKLLKYFRDSELESQGYRQIASINGGLFFTEAGITYADGIEKAYGIINELDDSSLDKCMALAVNNGMPYIASQAYIKANEAKFRGYLTGAFGLLNNGIVDTRGAFIDDDRKVLFNAKSGRSIIGKKPDGTIVFASVYGITGSSGITGAQTLELAKKLGLNNAICMDGGGSVCLRYDGVMKLSTSRYIKNAGGIYVR